MGTLSFGAAYSSSYMLLIYELAVTPFVSQLSIPCAEDTENEQLSDGRR